MQFPCLTLEQLKPLEDEFVSFLIVNGVEGETWKTLNEITPQKAEELVNLFSQLVWEKILKETHYVKRSNETERVVVYFGVEEGEVIIGQLISDGWVFHSGKKQWKETRELEVLNFLSQGFERASEHEFNALKELIKS
jgi:hypothetical protein